ncbi:MAG: hypothetical protein IPK19_20740 [Chloroflexi bacterium]|nr:hypothetical protein [Chloroflexota bacterium]
MSGDLANLTVTGTGTAVSENLAAYAGGIFAGRWRRRRRHPAAPQYRQRWLHHRRRRVHPPGLTLT